MKKSSGGKAAEAGAEDAEKRAPLLRGDGGARAEDLLPPDGGWGWMVVLATALSNITIIPIMQTFALVYKDKFASIGLSATDISVIINVNTAFGMCFGFVHGFILKRLGYRKVGIIAAIIVFVGVLSTSVGNSFAHFFITYGLITSLGANLVTPSFSLALNSYFKERRGKAMGLAMTLTGVGPTVMPLLLSQLLAVYGVSGTGLIVSGLALHTLVGALLLQPVKWHMRRRPGTELLEPRNGLGRSASKEDGVAPLQLPVDHDVDAQCIYGMDTPVLQRREYPHTASRESVKETEEASANRQVSIGVVDPNRTKTGYNWWSVPSVDSVHLGSSVTIFDERSQPDKEAARTRERKITIAGPIPEEDQLDVGNRLAAAGENDRTQSFGNLNSYAGNNLRDYRTAKKLSTDSFTNGKKLSDAHESVAAYATDNPEEHKKERRSLLKTIVRELDLSLLKDLSYVNLLIGMSIAITAEINFSLFTPLILSDLGFTDNQIALTMSTISGVDIVFRFLSPFFADYMKYSAKTMYLISMCMLIISRTTMIFFSTFFSLILVSLALGVSKGVRTVYMSLVIPNYVPLEKLASASGMQMVVNAFFFLTCGPLIGFVRDTTGTYNSCIIFINFLTLATIIMWTTEIFYKKFKAKSAPSAA